MVEYETFEDWFNELEGFSFRSERFFQHLELAKTQHERQEFCEKWLRTAFDMGRGDIMSGFESKKQMANSRWTIEIQEDPETGDHILEFPPDLIEQTGWAEGDELIWEEMETARAWTIRKKP